MYDVCSKHDDFKSEFREVSKRSSNEVVSRLIFFILFGNFSIAYLRIRKKIRDQTKGTTMGKSAKSAKHNELKPERKNAHNVSRCAAQGAAVYLFYKYVLFYLARYTSTLGTTSSGKRCSLCL